MQHRQSRKKCNGWMQSPVIGDLSEEYRLIARDTGRGRALRWLSRQVLRTLVALMHSQFRGSSSMFKSYLFTAMRNFRRHRDTTLVNLIGLTVGMTATLLIFCFVADDLSYDRFHAHRDSVYRVYYETTHSGKRFAMAPTMLPLAPALKSGYPEIEAVARISQINGFPYFVNQKIFRERLYFVDAEILDILSLPLKLGDRATALSQPNNIILTEAQAHRFFGDENPLGRRIELDRGKQYTVSGVFARYPRQSHLRLSAMASIESQVDTPPHQQGRWTNLANDYTYLKLKPGTDPAALEAKFGALLRSHLKDAEIDKDALRLQTLTDIHFTQLNYDNARTSSRDTLTGFSVVGFFILLIACFNFINLTTARIALRSREVGIRKVAGAQRFELIRQFLTESVTLSFMAMLLAVLLAVALLPPFSGLMERQLDKGLLMAWPMVPVYLLLGMGVGVLAGLYPALRLAGVQPMAAFRQIRQRQQRRISARTVMVVLQFAISIFLIIATLTVQRQHRFMLQKPLGFEHDQVVGMHLNNTPYKRRTEALKTEVLSHPGVLQASFSHSVPASGYSTASTYTTQGEHPVEVHLNGVLSDGDLLKTLGLKLVAGRDFSVDHRSDAEEAVILNQCAVDQLGLAAPLGRCLEMGGNVYRVIGVVKDTHFDSMQEKIKPMVYHMNHQRINFLSVRYDPTQAVAVRAHLKAVWEKVMPGMYTLRLHEFDEAFGRYYRFEKRMMQMFSVMAGLALLISCMGMVALAAFVVNRRLKEVGIRKVMGASSLGLSRLLVSAFVKWVLAAAVVGVPLAYWLMNGWLSQYAYRTEISPWLAVIGVILSLLMSIISVGHQIWRASRIQPVAILNQE